MFSTFPLFDSHFHIIDPQYPLIANQGYLPPSFTTENYLKQTQEYQLCGGAVVSGSFQGFDQSYLIHALKQLGPQFVGVTQLPADVTDNTIIELDKAGIRALRFNLKRGGSENISELKNMANRVFALTKWHVELYIDSADLPELYDKLISLPAVSIDHLGLNKTGFNTLLKLVEKGVKVKATGFSRVNFNVKSALKALYDANPSALMFGTDLPSTRAPQPYKDEDFLTVIDALGENAATAVFSSNAQRFYQN